MLSASSTPSAAVTERVAAGTVLLRRSVAAESVWFIESGRVGLGLAGTTPDEPLEHQLGVVDGPAWLEAHAAVLGTPSAMDAVAQTPLLVHRYSLAEFRLTLASASPQLQVVLRDMAGAYRQQSELAVSRFAKDAEARCAEWLLRHAQSTDKGICSVQLQQRKRLIAAQLGIAPETLSRVLRHLRERSLISGSGRTVNLVDPSGLRSLAGI